MKTFIEKVLAENEFSIDNSFFEDERVFQADRVNENAFDFLTVFQIDNNHLLENELINIIDQLYLDLSEKKGEIAGIDKNISLLILLKVDSLEYTPEIQSLIFDIEENPYMFKKNVLTYTDEQENLLTTLIKESNNDVTSLLYNVLYDKEKFSTFKNRTSNEDFLVYDLVSKMFIKIPYLSIRNQYEKIDSLSKEILSSFEKNDRDTWNVLMKLREQKDTNLSIQEILTIMEDYDFE